MKTKEVVKYAVVGLGHIAQSAVLPAFRHARSNSILTAVVSGNVSKRNAIRKKYGVDAYRYEDYDSLLKSGDVQAVYIALPNDQHMDFAVRAARSGVHVLCEKPMAVTSRECERMIEAANKNNVKLMIAYRLHFDRDNMEAVRIANSGELGDVRFFSSIFSINVKEGNYRLDAASGGGAVYDLGIYCINAARYLFKAEPTEVTATSANNGAERFRGIDEMTSVTLRFPGERLAQFISSFGASNTSAYDLVGTKGSLRMEQGYEYLGKRTMTVVKGEKTKRKTFVQTDQFAAEIIAFSDCILKNRRPEPSGEEGLRDLQIVEAIYRSAKIRRPIAIHRLPIGRKRPSTRQVIRRPAIKKAALVATEKPLK